MRVAGWRDQHIRLVAQLAAQPRVALAPGLEAPGDRVEQPGFRRGWFLNGRPAEKTRAQFGIPANVVPPAHLIFEEARQQQALRARFSIISCRAAGSCRRQNGRRPR